MDQVNKVQAASAESNDMLARAVGTSLGLAVAAGFLVSRLVGSRSDR